jgi:hypothetical protein
MASHEKGICRDDHHVPSATKAELVGRRQKRGKCEDALEAIERHRILEYGKLTESFDHQMAQFHNGLIAPYQSLRLSFQRSALPFFQSPLFHIPLAPAILSHPSINRQPANPRK